MRKGGEGVGWFVDVGEKNRGFGIAVYLVLSHIALAWAPGVEWTSGWGFGGCRILPASMESTTPF